MMIKNLIINSGKISLAFSVLLISGCSLNFKTDDKSEQKDNYEKLTVQVRELEKELIFAKKPDSYILNIKQIGGVGAKIVQATANLETEHGYLNPTEDWYSHSFNSPADVIHLNCADGYYITKCMDSDNNWLETYENKICSATIKDKFQNNFELRCVKGSYSKDNAK